MTKSGMGISVLPFFAVQDDLKNGTLSLIEQREKPLLLRMLLVRGQAKPSKAIASFIEMAKIFAFKQPLIRQYSAKAAAHRLHYGLISYS